MAVAQYRDIVEHVQVGAALHVDQVIAPATLDARRVDVIVLLRAGEAGIAPGQQGFWIHLRLGVTGQAQQRRRRWAQRLPGRSAGRRAEQWRIKVNPAQLHGQCPARLPQDLAFEHCGTGLQGIFQALQPYIQLRAMQT